MPVQFVCPLCASMLSVGSRKIGMTVDCPKCRRPIVVPTVEAAAASVAMSQSLASAAGEASSPEFLVFDDLPTELPKIDVTLTLDRKSLAEPASSAATIKTADIDLSAPALKNAARESGHGTMLLISRTALCLQGLLLLFVAGACFGIGYLAGYGTVPTQAKNESRQPLALSGKLTFSSGGKSQADDGAAVIVLPEGRELKLKLSTAGLKPSDPPPAASLVTVLAIEDLGGGYARTSADGSYSVDLPQGGRYFVLFLSRHAKRNAGEKPSEIETALIAKYFEGAQQLLEPQQHRWKLKELAPPAATISHEFAAGK